MKKKNLIIFVIIILLVALFLIFKMDSKNVKEEALKLYNQKKDKGMNFNSQCLGTIEVDGEKYAVDIVHVPRTEEDNLVENQCADFREGKFSHFIELDKDGNVVRIV